MRPPRDLTDDPEAWTRLASADPVAEPCGRSPARLADALVGQELSLRQAAAGSGVNQQAIADLLAGRSWPAVVTVARLGAFTGTSLWPEGVGVERGAGH